MLSGPAETCSEARNVPGYFVVTCSRLCFSPSPWLPSLLLLLSLRCLPLASPYFGRRGRSGRTSDRSSAAGPSRRTCPGARFPALSRCSPSRARACQLSRGQEGGEERERRRRVGRARTSPKWLECVSSSSRQSIQGIFFFFKQLEVDFTPSDGRIKHNRHGWKRGEHERSDDTKAEVQHWTTGVPSDAN